RHADRGAGPPVARAGQPVAVGELGDRRRGVPADRDHRGGGRQPYPGLLQPTPGQVVPRPTGERLMDHESADSPEVIEREMEATRASLTDKVAALEQQVLCTIQNASDSVSNIVETVKTVVPETLTSVKDTLTESV